MSARLLVMAACLLATPAASHAQARLQAHAPPALPQGAEPRVGRYVEFIVDDTGSGLAAGVFELPLSPGGLSEVVFPETIQTAAGLPDRSIEIAVDQRKAAIYSKRRQIRQDLRRNVTFSTASIMVSLRIRPAETQDEAITLAVVRRRSEVERQQAEVSALLAATERERERDARQQANREMLGKFLHSAAIVRPSTVEGDVIPYQPGAPDITLYDFEGAWIGPNDFFLRFTLENNGDRAFSWAEVQALGPDRVENHAGVAEVFTPATTDTGLIGEIPAHGRVRAGIHVERAREIGGALTIVLSDRGGSRPVIATLRHWLPIALQPEHDVRMWEFRPVQPPDPERDKVSLHLQGVYGAIWLGDGAGLGKSDATSMKGLGVRAQYAFNRYIAVEGEAMGASTGEARFDNVTYEGMQGDLARRAALGRAQFGGVLRFSEGPYVPLLRLGVGLQGASHRGTLTTATGEAPGPDAFEFDALWHFGVGMDLRFGDSVVAGFTASGVAIGGGLQSIEAAFHLGYRWNP